MSMQLAGGKKIKDRKYLATELIRDDRVGLISAVGRTRR